MERFVRCQNVQLYPSLLERVTERSNRQTILAKSVGGKPVAMVKRKITNEDC
jgi:hypothetical protein